MRHAFALLGAAAFSLTACSEDPVPNQTEGLNQLEAGENAIWNDLATVPAEENLAEPAPEADEPGPGEPAPASARTKSPSSDTSPSRQPDAAPKKAASPPPPANPVTAPTEPSTDPKAPCTPEHAAMGHCRL